jgi:hypothetical protein
MQEGMVRVRRIPAVFMGCVIGFISGRVGLERLNQKGLLPTLAPVMSLAGAKPILTA